MFPNGFLICHPLFRASFIPPYHTAVTHRMTKETLQKGCTKAALTDLPPKYSTIFLLAERLRIVYIHEMAQLIQF